MRMMGKLNRIERGGKRKEKYIGKCGREREREGGEERKDNELL